MKVTLVLADFAQVADGKLTVVGGGWTMTGPGPVPHGIGLIFEVPWDRGNEQIAFRLDLVDSDGDPVLVEEQPIVFEGSFETGRPPGLKPGTALSFPVGINFAPPPLEPGGRYEWRLTVNAESHADWRLPFSVRAA